MPTEARDLKSTVTEIEKNKNNLKKAKNNIDNKLVELGGDASTNIFNVPEKIEKMSEEYLKYAYIKDFYKNFDDFFVIATVEDWGKEVVLKFNTNFSFIPKSIYIKLFGEMRYDNSNSYKKSFSGQELSNFKSLEYTFYFHNVDYIIQISLNVLNEKESEIKFKAKSKGSSASEKKIYIKDFFIGGGVEAFSKLIERR